MTNKRMKWWWWWRIERNKKNEWSNETSGNTVCEHNAFFYSEEIKKERRQKNERMNEWTNDSSDNSGS